MADNGPGTGVAFRRETKRGRFHDPRAGFALSEVESEIRYDPLTGDSARICHFSLTTAPPSDLAETIAASERGCPFCPGRVLEVTPRFPEDLVPAGRLVRGASVLFPNLFPYDDHSAIAVVSDRHVLPMADMPEDAVVDGLTVARDFIRLLDAHVATAGEPSYGLVTWNHMPPSGGSQLHPHMQVIHTTRPGNALRRQLAAESAWLERHHRPFLADLVAAERNLGERWIGESGSVAWLAPFAPTGLLGDCMAVFPRRRAIGDLTDRNLADFSRGLRRVLAYFAGRGLWSFNLVFLGDRSGAEDERHWLSARVIPRFYVNAATHASDVAYMQLVLEERFAMTYPEDTAAALRAAWSAGGT